MMFNVTYRETDCEKTYTEKMDGKCLEGLARDGYFEILRVVEERPEPRKKFFRFFKKGA